MQNFDELSQQDRLTAIMRASQWRKEHLEHVKRLMSDTGTYPPSGSDIDRPELWKPAHWRWFETLVPIKPKG